VRTEDCLQGFGADDGTRTHDLLHGKCARPFAPVRARSLKTLRLQGFSFTPANGSEPERTPNLAILATDSGVERRPPSRCCCRRSHRRRHHHRRRLPTRRSRIRLSRVRLDISCGIVARGPGYRTSGGRAVLGARRLAAEERSNPIDDALEGVPRPHALVAFVGLRVPLEPFAEASAYRGVKATLALSDH
jgi:hypothetical protein